MSWHNWLGNKKSLFISFLLLHTLLCAHDTLLECTSDLKQEYLNLIEQAEQCIDQHNIVQAIALYRQAEELKQTIVLDYIATGSRYNHKGHTDAALRWYNKAVTFAPHCAQAHYHLGHTYWLLRNTKKALEHLDHALAYDPYHKDAHVARAHVNLARGNFALGWYEHEWWLHNTWHDDHASIKPKDFAGKTVLLHLNGGFGDVFQFIRYAKLVQECGARVLMYTHPALITLLSSCPYIDEFIDVVDEQHPPDYADMHIILSSLPLIFNTTKDTIPCEVPYIYPDPDLVLRYDFSCGKITQACPEISRRDERDKRVMAKNFRIGLCWSAHEEKDKKQRVPIEYRSIPLELLRPLTSFANTHFYSLQKNFGLEQLEDVRSTFNIHTFDNLDEHHGAFMDTAAIMQHLDLVITVDTSIAHLAGALGVPVWVMLPYAAEWRWMLNRPDSPWYPTMKLFRQKEPGDWKFVVEEIRKELKKHYAY